LTDTAIMRAAASFLSVPALFLILSSYAVRREPRQHALVIALVTWAPVGSIVRSECLSLRNRDFVHAAAASARSRAHPRRHLLANALPIVIVQAQSPARPAILIESGLSYLGLGAQRRCRAGEYGRRRPAVPGLGLVDRDVPGLAISSRCWFNLSATGCATRRIRPCAPLAVTDVVRAAGRRGAGPAGRGAPLNGGTDVIHAMCSRCSVATLVWRPPKASPPARTFVIGLSGDATVAQPGRGHRRPVVHREWPLVRQPGELDQGLNVKPLLAVVGGVARRSHVHVQAQARRQVARRQALHRPRRRVHVLLGPRSQGDTQHRAYFDALAGSPS